jgi:hypothetical protein
MTGPSSVDPTFPLHLWDRVLPQADIKLHYAGEVVTSTADITTFKILINSNLSTEEAATMVMDIKSYHLSNPLPTFEYIKMFMSHFPDEIIQKYNLNALAVDSWVYIEIRKDMYGLKQAGLFAS